MTRAGDLISGSRHPDARRIVASGLFHDLSTFRELERRISALPTEAERGKAFEVFAEAYLATQAIIQAAEVWPFGATPASIRRRLRLGKTDLGVDGIVRTSLGEFHAYQVKFRSARAPLTWTELSTFVALADYVQRRVLFTNCEAIADVLEDRRNFYCIRGSDLDRLEGGDFAVLLGWLQHRIVPPPKKTPRPDQREAVDAILDGLRKNDRVTAVMACGTGKTLVQLWSAERLGCRRILVLVPSLALLRQTLHLWLGETSWPSLSYLAVCSDPTVKPDDDPLIVRQGDLDFPVTTDSETVRRFLSQRPEGVQIVFSTYHSAPVVAEGCPDDHMFDVAIFDEAHWTAGRQGQRFAFALTDDHVAARKRLFMTATPRHYASWRRDKYGDLGLVYSMDQPETYGQRAYTLSFAEAARQGIICNYKVIISVVTSAMVNEELLRRGEVLVQGDPVRARQVANQIALQKAVEQVAANKIITFHGTVRSAASFTSTGSDGIHNHLPVFQTYHVNGTMRAADRDNLMQEFRDAVKGVMSNARCLTEGVDVPAVDMVAFLAPRRSRVDIVQAVGRAMRTAPGKTTGYVFLPLYVQEAVGESVEDAVDRTEFDEVWNVLQALQEQDEVLADIIREIREAQGRIGGFDDSRFREKVQILGPAVSLNVLRDGITTRCVERVAASWDHMYGKLVAFKDRFNHCNVLHMWPEDPQLGSWVSRQRRLKSRSYLTADRVKRLEALGFEWDPLSARTEEMFARLVRFKERSGHCNVPTDWAEDPQLWQWASSRRQLRRRDRLPSDQLRRLEALGFEWDPRTAYWEEMFARLVRFKERSGHCNVPRNLGEDDELANWIHTQRQLRSRGQMPGDRVQRLEALGFEWDPLSARTEEMFARLVRFKERSGHCNVPTDWAEDPQLWQWASSRRQLRRRDRLPSDQLRRLEALGFEWDPRTAYWEEMFARLVQYKKQRGDCNVPMKWKEDPQLANWVRAQRQFRSRGQMPGDRVHRLEALGFEWNPHTASWEEMFARLVQYKAKCGDCNVPMKWKEDPQLARWVNNQRQLKQRGLLFADRLQRLDALSFKWEPRMSSWEKMFARLVRFRERVGDCLVPRNWPEDPQLNLWVSTQRQFMRRGHLSADRVQRLAMLGFKWSPKRGPQRKAR